MSAISATSATLANGDAVLTVCAPIPELLDATFIDPLYELALELTAARKDVDFALGGTADAMDSGVNDELEVELLNTWVPVVLTDRSV